MIYFILFTEFFKIGLFTIGGGLAALPLLKEVIDKYGWITNEQLLNMIAISESTPGPIGINVATFVGHDTINPLGGIVATIGLALPSVIIIILVARYFIKFNEHPLVQGALNGIRPAVTGLIFFVAFDVGKVELVNLEAAWYDLLAFLNFKALLLFVVLFYLIRKYDKHPILYLAGAAVVGIIFQY
jgi:chromate transporter